MGASRQQDLAEQMAKLRAVYMARLPVELAELQALAGGLQGGEGDRPSLEALYQRLHKLAGSGGTFGLAALGAAARVLEQRTRVWLAGALDDGYAAARRAFAAELAELVQWVVPGAGERATPSSEKLRRILQRRPRRDDERHRPPSRPRTPLMHPTRRSRSG